MNYRRIYNDLIMRGWRRTALEGYCEKHHIIPRCLKGGNEATNIVRLTAREHFIAHLLLTRMYPDNSGLATAVFLMSHLKNFPVIKSSKIFAKIKHSLSLARSLEQTGRTHTDESKKKMSLAKKGKKFSEEQLKKLAEDRKLRPPMSEETKKKMSEAGKRRRVSEETRRKMSESSKGRKMSEESRRKISASTKGKVVSEETRKKMSEAAKIRATTCNRNKSSNTSKKSKIAKPTGAKLQMLSAVLMREQTLFWSEL